MKINAIVYKNVAVRISYTATFCQGVGSFSIQEAQLPQRNTVQQDCSLHSTGCGLK